MPDKRRDRGSQGSRGVAPVVSVLLIATVAILLAAAVGVFALAFADDGERSSSYADFDADLTPSISSSCDSNAVRITHGGGDSLSLESIELIVRVEGQQRAKLVDLPVSSGKFDSESIEGNEGVIDTRFGCAQGVLDERNDNMWTAGDVAQFRVPTGAIEGNETITVSILDTEENAVLGDVAVAAGR